MLSGFVIAFLPRSKCLLISWLPSPSAVMLEPKKIKSVTLYIVSPSIFHEVMGPEALIDLWMLSFKSAFSLSLSSRGSLVPLHFLPEGWCHLHIWGYCIPAYLTSLMELDGLQYKWLLKFHWIPVIELVPYLNEAGQFYSTDLYDFFNMVGSPCRNDFLISSNVQKITSSYPSKSHSITPTSLRLYL